MTETLLVPLSTDVALNSCERGKSEINEEFEFELAGSKEPPFAVNVGRSAVFSTLRGV